MASSAMTVAALIFSLFSLSNSINVFPLSSHYRSIGRPSPPFPSSLIKPELLKPIISYSSEKVYYEIKYFTQTLDHFNYVPWGYETFQQRYYGESIPYGSEEIAYKNACTHGYLSSAQALADYAMLIIDLKKNSSAEDSPVVVMGGSYGGMLARWFRLKYPHVCIGALASSTPILNFADITSPYSFNNIVTEDFRGESENCYKVIKNSWRKIHETVQQPGGLEELRKSFRICPNHISKDSLTNWLERAFIYTAMTDYPVPSNFLAPLPAFPIKQMCKAVDDAGDEVFKGIYEAANIFYNYTGDSMCFNLSNNSDAHGLNGWGFQVLISKKGEAADRWHARGTQVSYNGI
ncbi:lysosomal Pro-X carboxypeptidase-like [Amborella trichopoda]|uniref:lysosomal Pro-X carboxypeptidase-like n=1 Tax=Amborella trichopoda TaxID=13333 RepID=UPI0009BE2C17|nr:lysosomal Pro-X carboxypeptidase-like [Amborella trichopoda]|eukprot:XP_020529346.1 lysosomal Pro-X carboxypeptidase-like [Amborella trichopoda]